MVKKHLLFKDAGGPKPEPAPKTANDGGNASNAETTGANEQKAASQEPQGPRTGFETSVSTGVGETSPDQHKVAGLEDKK